MSCGSADMHYNKILAFGICPAGFAGVAESMPGRLPTCQPNWNSFSRAPLPGNTCRAAGRDVHYASRVASIGGMSCGRLQVMQTLKDLAGEGKTVVCSIHQPRSSIFEVCQLSAWGFVHHPLTPTTAAGESGRRRTKALSGQFVAAVTALGGRWPACRILQPIRRAQPARNVGPAGNVTADPKCSGPIAWPPAADV